MSDIGEKNTFAIRFKAQVYFNSALLNFKIDFLGIFGHFWLKIRLECLILT